MFVKAVRASEGVTDDRVDNGSPRRPHPNACAADVVCLLPQQLLRAVLETEVSAQPLFKQKELRWKTKRRNMSVSRGISTKAESRKCAERFWRIFPHLLLCLSLVAFAALGAVMFQHIEGGNTSTTQDEYHEFLGQIVSTVQNLTGKWTQISTVLVFYGHKICGSFVLSLKSRAELHTHKYF